MLLFVCFFKFVWSFCFVLFVGAIPLCCVHPPNFLRFVGRRRPSLGNRHTCHREVTGLVTEVGFTWTRLAQLCPGA